MKHEGASGHDPGFPMSSAGPRTYDDSLRRTHRQSRTHPSVLAPMRTPSRTQGTAQRDRSTGRQDHRAAPARVAGRGALARGRPHWRPTMAASSGKVSSTCAILRNFSAIRCRPVKLQGWYGPGNTIFLIGTAMAISLWPGKTVRRPPIRNSNQGPAENFSGWRRQLRLTPRPTEQVRT